MGCTLSGQLPVDKGIVITVKTGDLNFSGTDNDVYIILYDDQNNSTGKLKLDNTLRNDFEKGQEDRYVFKDEALESLAAITNIELWREGDLINDEWFVDYVKVHNAFRGSTHIFPIHRWVPLSDTVQHRALLIKEYDSCFACDDEDRHDQRSQELNRKQNTYKIKHYPEGKGMPPGAADLPNDEVFSDNYQWDLTKRAYQLFLTSKLKNVFRGRWQKLQDVKTMYGSESFPIPGSIKEDGLWMNDEYFADRCVAGCNPLHIKLCTAIPENFAVTQEMVQPFLEGATLQSSLENKRLFIVNHSITEDLVKSKDDLILCSPMCLFYVNNEKRLLPIAIQLFQAPAEDNPVFLPSDPKYTWLIAKMWFNNADANVHESISHMGFTHILMECVALAAHRHLSPSHPLFRLLAPHFLFLIAINRQAISTLLAPAGWLDKNMTMGAKGCIGLIGRAYPNWRLDVQGTLPEDLKDRGVADPEVLPYYPYRDDAILIYNAIKQYVTEILEHTYTYGQKTEAYKSIKSDTELQNWIKELSDPTEEGGFNMQGIPSQFSRVDELVLTVTSIIYVCSVLHATVNFKQYDDYAFVPSCPLILYGHPPTDKKERTESDVLNALPNMKTTQEIMIMTRILSDRGTRALGDFEVQYAYDECSVTALQRFCSNLKEVEKQIEERNQKRRIPYTVLKPSDVPNSISI